MWGSEGDFWIQSFHIPLQSCSELVRPEQNMSKRDNMLHNCVVCVD